MTGSDDRRIKNRALYETLVVQGMSKEKTARIANADRPGEAGACIPPTKTGLVNSSMTKPARSASRVGRR